MGDGDLRDGNAEVRARRCRLEQHALHRDLVTRHELRAMETVVEHFVRQLAVFDDREPDLLEEFEMQDLELSSDCF